MVSTGAKSSRTSFTDKVGALVRSGSSYEEVATEVAF